MPAIHLADGSPSTSTAPGLEPASGAVASLLMPCPVRVNRNSTVSMPLVLTRAMIAPGLRLLPLQIYGSGPDVAAMIARPSPVKARKVLAWNDSCLQESPAPEPIKRPGPLITWLPWTRNGCLILHADLHIRQIPLPCHCCGC